MKPILGTLPGDVDECKRSVIVLVRLDFDMEANPNMNNTNTSVMAFERRE
jgi:hypothetical protein